MIGALERPDSGSITVLGQTITDLASKDLAAYRRRVGFVFQRFNLLPTPTVLDNVLAPVLPFRPGPEVRDWARDLLAAVGLEGRDNTLATRMSGGHNNASRSPAPDRQPRPGPGRWTHRQPRQHHRQRNHRAAPRFARATRHRLIIATHDPDLASQCDRAIHLIDGKLED